MEAGRKEAKQMNASRIIFIFGTFFTSFGAVLLISEVPQWAWWTGKALVILGPLLTTSLALGKNETPAVPQEPINPTPEIKKIV